MKAEGILFMSKTRPLATTSAEGAFQLTVLGMDRIGTHQVEPWRITWVGDEAKSFWAAHGPALMPGQPLRVMVHRIRGYAIRHCAPEIQAFASHIELAPRSTESTHQRQTADV